MTDDGPDLTGIFEFVAYEPETGLFTSIKSGKGRSNFGEILGSVNVNGYVRISYNRRLYLAHRLAFMYMTGDWPDGYIDHINGIRSDNRFCNLRIATASENQFNRRVRRDSYSSLKGVRPHRGKWQARITFNRKTIHLGTFENKEDAHDAYYRAASQLFGDFSSDGINRR